jgi:hypothetical protein
MVFTAANTTSFFEDADQMNLSAEIRAALVAEGITSVEDLLEFKNSDWDTIAKNLRSPPQGQAALVIGAKSLKRLKVASNAIRYYTATGRTLTHTNVHYTSVLANFALQWEALMDKKKSEDAGDVPKLKGVKVHTWQESFEVYVQQKIGVRDASLAYVIRKVAEVPNAAPALARNAPHSVEHGSIDAEMTARLSHDSPLFKDDNEKVYSMLEAATRGTKFAPTIKPFARRHDGRGAYLALLAQHAGPDKWDSEVAEANDFLENRKWRGNNVQTLEKHLDAHRSAFITLEQAAEHVSVQVPSGRTRVTAVLKSIQDCTDPDVKAAVAAIRQDNGGMREDFERAVTFLLPCDPVARKRHKEKRPFANISSTDAAATVSGASGLKSGIGKTGVELRYHNSTEFKALEDAQRKELIAWRKNKRQDRKQSDSGDSERKRPAKKLKKMIASAVKAQFTKQQEATTSRDEQINEIRSILSSMHGTTANNKPAKRVTIAGTTGATAPNEDALDSACVKLQKLLKINPGE